ncbi:MAG: ATP-binding protein, partial [Actinomycetota bacterium]
MAKRTAAPLVRVFPARATSLAPIRRFIEQQAVAVGMARARRQDIVLAVTEGCSNAIRHTTTPEVTVSWEAEQGVVVVHVADRGIFRAPSPAPSGIGGFGLTLMRALADDLAIREGSPRRPGTIVRLVWRTGERPARNGDGGAPVDGHPPSDDGHRPQRPQRDQRDQRGSRDQRDQRDSGGPGGRGGRPAPPPGAAPADTSEPTSRGADAPGALRLRFLARASVAFGQAPIDARRVLDALLNIAVPELADYALLRLVAAEGALGDLEVRHTVSAMAVAAQELEGLEAGRAGYPVSEAIRTGQSQVVPQIVRDAGDGSPRDRARLDLLAQLGPRSALVIPIAVRGTVVAVLSLVTSVASGRRYT